MISSIKGVILLTLTLFAIALSNQSAYGQQRDSLVGILDTIHMLPELSVKAIRVQKEMIPVQVLKGEVLRGLNTYSVADALRYFSGVQIKDYGGIGGLKTVNVRSMGSQHVGVFYDGVEISNTQNGVVDLGRFSIDNMESVSLYNGQKSAIFQSAKDFSSASAIYLTPKEMSFRYDKSYNFTGRFATGSFGVLNPSLVWEQRLNSNVSSSLSANYMYTTGRYKFTYRKKDGYKTTATRRNGDVKALRLEHALHGKIKDGFWRTRLYYYDSERGYPGAIVRETPGEFKHQDRQWDKSLFAQFNIQKRISKVYSTAFSAKFGYDHMRYISDPNKDVSTMYVNNKYIVQDVYASTANMFDITPFWSVNASLDFQWNKMNANMYNFIYPQRYATYGVLATSFDFNRLKIQASILGTFVNESTQKNIETKDNWRRFTPTIVASWQPFEDYHLHLRAFYKRIFRMPTFSELYHTFLGSDVATLRPENSTQYNLGILYSKLFSNGTLNSIDFQVDAYYNEVTDQILSKPGGVNFRWTMMNIGRVKIRGIDARLGGNFTFGKSFNATATLNYTYQKAQDYSDPTEPSTYKGQISYIPWHSGSAIVGLEYQRWRLNYSFIYVGERYDVSANIPENFVKPWYTHDLGLSKEFDVGRTTLRLTAEVNNIFNQQYEVVIRYPMPGTNLKFIATINF